MGMYTELHFNSELRKETPIAVMQVLETMINNMDEPEILPDHALFKNPESRWRFMLQCDSYYFDADTHTTLRYDDISGSFYLNIRCNLKNYESDIENFIDWIMPWCDKYDGEFLGFYRYEEDEDPTLIHYKKTDYERAR